MSSFVYFISAGDYVKIGKANNIDERVRSIETGNPNSIILLGYIECGSENEAFTEERKAKSYFKEFHYNKEWYDSLMELHLNEYIMNKCGSIEKQKRKLFERKQTRVSTLYGIKPINEFRPRCYFYPDQVAMIMGKAGTKEKYRYVKYKGQKVPVSLKMWKHIMEFRRNAKQHDRM